MKDLFSTTQLINQPLKRNIVSLRTSQSLFDDLTQIEEEQQILIQTEREIKCKICSPDFLERSFHYSTAVEYPFHADRFMQTRYSDGSFGCWYGALELKTTIYETAYWMYQEESGIEDASHETEIIRERAVYDVHCEAILLDLRGKEKIFPGLIGNHYSLTHLVGKKVSEEGHPGMLTPSARCSGDCAVIFNPKVLREPTLKLYLTYRLNLAEHTMVVEREPGKLYTNICFKQ